MSFRCKLCQKKSLRGQTRILLRGNYNPTSLKRKYPNLQWLNVDGARLRACVRCRKTYLKKGVAK